MVPVPSKMADEEFPAGEKAHSKLPIESKKKRIEGEILSLKGFSKYYSAQIKSNDRV